MFLLVTTMYWSQRKMRATGITLCDLL